MPLRYAAVLLLAAVACGAVACGGTEATGDDLKPLWPTYAETRPTTAAPAAEVGAPAEEAGPAPVVLLLPSLSCARCYRATVRAIEANPDGLRRHEIDVAAGEVRLYPETDGYRPDSIIAALHEAGYIARIKGE